MMHPILRLAAAVTMCAALFVAASPAAAASTAAQDLITGAWALYASRFVSPEGRIVDDGNGGISHSEGQGYGLILAVAADDRPAFAKILGWTQRELFVRPDGLAAWSWTPNAAPHVKDRNNATDGDILIAWALLRASVRWNEPAYRDSARQIADTIARTLVVKSRYGNLLLPAAEGFSGDSQPDGPVINLSYWVFPAIEELETVSPDLAKAGLIGSGHRLAAEARFGRLGLAADWIGLGTEAAGLKPAANFPPTYGYNALRVPLYLAWSKTPRPDLLKPYADATDTSKGIARVIDLASGIGLDALSDPGYGAIADVVACSLERIEVAGNARAFVPTHYYPSTLHLLSLLAIAERFPQCL